MLIQELFRRVVAGRSQLLQDIATVLVPRILQEFSAIPALGGSGQFSGISDPELEELLGTIPSFTPEELQIFSAKGFDQSLATHLINGLFAGMFLAERLPDYKKLEDVALRVWVLGYAVHDYTKAYGRKVGAGLLPTIRQLISQLGKLLEFASIIDNWQDYLDDIVFIAQNTQTVQGANLNLRDYSLRLNKHQRETTRILSSVTDLLVHITSPSDVHFRDVRGRDLAYNMRQKLDVLFGSDMAPRLTYHKLLEVRGLLSNLINNALMDAFRQQGYEPFLFFPEGVVYLSLQNSVAQPDLEELPTKVWRRITMLLTGSGQTADNTEEDTEDAEDEDGTGLRITRKKDFMKVPPILYELLDTESLMEAGRRTAIAIRNSKTAARLGAEQADEQELNFKGLNLKEKEARFIAIGNLWAKEQQLPVDVRVDQLAEFLAFLYRRVFAELYPKLQGVTTMLLECLGLAEKISPARAGRQRVGGTPTGWFFVAACYLQAHPDLSPQDLEDVMKELTRASLKFIESSGQAGLKGSSTAKLFQDYARRIMEIDGHIIVNSQDMTKERFVKELQYYVKSKAEKKVVCSLCAGSYDAQEQDASVVLFKPQQYSNKSPLDHSRVVRGICPICALEMMLRQVQQGLVAGKAQDQYVINLYLYPTYFFTTETAQVVRLYANRFQNLNLRDLIYKHLERVDYDYQGLFTYEDFVIDYEEANGTPVHIPRKTQYSDEDLATLFIVPLRPWGQKLTETDAWIIPTFLTLALPLLLGVKCVATPSFIALYNSASDYQEVGLLDGAHSFSKYVLGRERFRINETPELVERLLRVYGLHLDVFADERNSHWSQLTSVAKDLATDPLYVFQYFDRYQRRNEERQAKGRNKRKQSSGGQQASKAIPLWEKQRYIGIYYAIGGDNNMGFIGKLVEAYAQFYRAENLGSAYAVLRPLSTAIDVIVESDPSTEMDDLRLLVAGAVNDDQERVRSDRAEGFDPIVTNKELGDYGTRLALSRQKIAEFSETVLQRCFTNYCNSDRALLRERTNRIRSAARFYYLTHYIYHVNN